MNTTENGNSIDFYAVYCVEINKCFLVPHSIVNTTTSLRAEATKNHQKKNINLAKEFELAAMVFSGST